MTRPTLALAICALLAGTAAQATTYVRVEKDGTKTYSDRPIPGGQPVDIQPAQTYSAPPPPASSSSSVPREQQLLQGMDSFRYEVCEITPKSDENFQNSQDVNISVSLRPLLRVGDTVDLQVDGRAIGSGSTLNYVMSPAERGTHTVSVLIKDRYGRQVCAANSQFHVHQPNLNSPTRQPAQRPNVPRPTPHRP